MTPVLSTAEFFVSILMGRKITSSDLKYYLETCALRLALYDWERKLCMALSLVEGGNLDRYHEKNKACSTLRLVYIVTTLRAKQKETFQR